MCPTRQIRRSELRTNQTTTAAAHKWLNIVGNIIGIFVVHVPKWQGKKNFPNVFFVQTGTYYQPQTPTHVRDTLVCTQMSTIQKKKAHSTVLTWNFFCFSHALYDGSYANAANVEVPTAEQPAARQPAAVEHTSTTTASATLFWAVKVQTKPLLKQ